MVRIIKLVSIVLVVLLTSSSLFAQSVESVVDAKTKVHRGKFHDRKIAMKPPREEGPMGSMEHRGPFGKPLDRDNFFDRDEVVGRMAIAEAHKELSALYETQGKIDDAANELKKIIELFDSLKDPEAEGKKFRSAMQIRIIPVYQEIARLYLKNDRANDAEKVINEAIKKYESNDTRAVSRLLLQLGEINKHLGKTAEAEEIYKRIIELNSPSAK